MARLTEEMVIARSKQSDLSAVKKLNCWGAELGDVSLLRRMPNVEVLALSINKIRTLSDVAGCVRLRELYIRKNEIRELQELRHLRNLPDLTSLWLDENPCTQHPQYRMTVLRNLPNLEKLDNVPVQPEEVAEAMRRGVLIVDSDDEEEYNSQGRGQRWDERETQRPASCESSPDRQSERSYRPAHYEQQPASPPSPPRRAAPSSPPVREPQAMTRSHYQPRSPDAGSASLRHSFSAQSVKEYSYSSNGDCRYSGGSGGGNGDVTSPHHYHEPAPAHCCDRSERWESYPASERGAPEQWERDRDRDSGGAYDRDRDGAREFRSAVMGERRGFTRRPVARNSNLLSAVLCLVKELDYPSLEVAEMAVRCRMDELANSQ